MIHDWNADSSYRIEERQHEKAIRPET